jgi:hypothetical protein
MDEYHSGSTLTIWLCNGAEESWSAAESSVGVAQQAQFRARLGRLAEAGWLRSPDHMNFEGDGIYAVKGTSGLRAYGWFGQVGGRKAFVVSHVIFKKQQKLDRADLAKAVGKKAAYQMNRREQ